MTATFFMAISPLEKVTGYLWVQIACMILSAWFGQIGATKGLSANGAEADHEMTPFLVLDTHFIGKVGTLQEDGGFL